MNRRKFLAASAGLFAPAAPAIIRPSNAQILQFSGSPPPPPPGNTIPMSLSDPRFSGNTAGTPGQTVTTGTLANKTWNESPGYANGDPAILWNASSGTFNLIQCSFDWREGVRIAGTNGSALNIDQCFINTIGFAVDHADGIQAYGGDISNISLTNSCLRSYSDTEAVSVYGPTATGSGGWFWADNNQGTITFNNVLIWGAQRGVAIYADTGTTTIDFQNVYFVPSPDGSAWPDGGYDYDIRGTGGTLSVARWSNVRAATIVGGVIVPGALLPSP